MIPMCSYTYCGIVRQLDGPLHHHCKLEISGDEMEVPGCAGTIVVVPFSFYSGRNIIRTRVGGDVFRCLHVLRATLSILSDPSIQPVTQKIHQM